MVVLGLGSACAGILWLPVVGSGLGLFLTTISTEFAVLSIVSVLSVFGTCVIYGRSKEKAEGSMKSISPKDYLLNGLIHSSEYIFHM